MAWFSKFLIAALSVFCISPADAESSSSEASAVVLMYHRFGEGKYPSTNTTLAQLDAHIAYLQHHKFNVVPLADVVAALRNHQTLPGKTVAITIDDAYRSVFTQAWPRFKKAGFPFTVFVATQAVDKAYADIMTWDQLRQLKAAGVALEGHSHTHAHAPALSAAAFAQDLDTMLERFQTELGIVPKLYAHAYGEAGLQDFEIIRKAGFIAAFGQNSGPAYAEAHPYLLPRFALNETYGAMDRFALVVNSKPLRATNITPGDPVLRGQPRVLSFTVKDKPGDLSTLSCFGPRGDAWQTVVQNAEVTITPSVFPKGRARVNCTINLKSQWYWFGQEFLAGGETEGVPVHARYKN